MAAWLAVAASAWGVLMGLSPVLQIRRMLRERSSREVSLGYFAILLFGFVLWLGYGAASGDLVLVIPNLVALVVGVVLVIIAVRLRPRPGSQPPPADGQADCP
jgi:MtN3 and saliva related transmembrane protein